ncbi:MAG: SpoIIE family protein phosphatase [Streptosporangiaceae bacterium]|nr:SpoIIE family protein phosphatase [Streptosporangiaceae bacterium]
MAVCGLTLDCGTGITQEVADFVGVLAKKAGLRSEQAYWLRLAAEEITTNIAQHGYHGGAGLVQLTAGMEGDRVWIRIEDEAPEFDPTKYRQDCPRETELAERAAGGHGLLLAFHKLDEFGYERAGSRNRCTLIMFREPAVLAANEQPRTKDPIMSSTTALVIAEPSAVTQELGRGLTLGGFDVRHATPDDVELQAEAGIPPDMLLISAALGIRRVALLSRQFLTEDRAPTTVVFPEDDVTELEPCVRFGFDYVVPPFLPTLLRTRLTTCWERAQLNTSVEEMATVASLRSYERELSVAREIQAGFLPEEIPCPEGWQIDVQFRPARRVGGDFYDVFRVMDGRMLGLVIADVCDKGVGAALFMALIRTVLRHATDQASKLNLLSIEPLEEAEASGPALPASVPAAGAGPLLAAVTGTNSYMARHHRRQGYFCTLFFAILDPGSGMLLYINGGHQPQALIRADGHYTLLAPTGPAVGMFAHSSYVVQRESLQPGDSLFMYTDGVTEARAPDGGLFGLERTLDAAIRHRESASDLIGGVGAATYRYAAAIDQSDDLTMLAIRRAEAAAR